MQTAELAVKVKKLANQLDEASAKGFKTDASLMLLYEIESAIGKLIEVATAEFWASAKAGGR